MGVILRNQLKFDHVKAVTRVKNWWSLTGSLEEFTVIIAKPVEDHINNLEEDEEVKNFEFIRHLKECKTSVIDISKEAPIHQSDLNQLDEDSNNDSAVI